MRIKWTAGRLVAVGLVVTLVAAACDDSGVETTTTTQAPPAVATTTTVAAVATTKPVVEEGPVGPDMEAIARATVQVIQLIADDSGDLLFGCFTGSGSVIQEDGLILTNAHVIENDPQCPYDTIGIAVTAQADQPPTLTYLADLLVVDQALDLAVLRVSTDIDGSPVTPSLPFLAIGDSGTVGIGDGLRILGYPGIGGETITLTQGTVSGFVEGPGIDGRAWIKTDATISGGNSGGVAVIDSGLLVGVPTIVGSGAEVELADCRFIQDTNSDGFLDSNDSCIPVGGFLNGLRPINLALPLIDEAATASPIDIPVIVTAAEAVFGPIVFSVGVTDDDLPTELVDFIPGGVAAEVCGFWDYVGMVDGVSHDALWYYEGELNEDASFIDVAWNGGPTGNWWVCFINPEGTLPDGIYELVLHIQGESVQAEAIQVGGDGARATLELVNESLTEICFVHISLSRALDWGPDELGAEELIPVGATRVFDLPGGVYDVLGLACDGDIIFENFGLEVFGPFVLNYQ